MTLDDDIRRAGARLAATPVPVPDLGRRIRRGRIRTLAATGTVAALVWVSALLLWPSAEPTRVETTGGQVSAVPTWELVLEDAELIGDETLNATNTDVALWADDAERTYVSLSVRPGLAEAYPEPVGIGAVQEDTALPASQGRAWYTEATGEAHSTTMWWSRPDGDVWFLTAHWHGQPPTRAADAHAALRQRAHAIETGSAAPNGPAFRMVDPTMRLVSFDDAGERRSRGRTWRYRGHEIVLLTTERSGAAGMSNLFSQGENVPEPVTVNGQAGWKVNGSTGETLIGWAADTTPVTWSTLTIPPGLTEDADTILAALQPS
jgi:hypothetical protein